MRICGINVLNYYNYLLFATCILLSSLMGNVSFDQFFCEINLFWSMKKLNFGICCFSDWIIEMMKFGFMSFILTISEVPISKICISKGVANSFLPCKDVVGFTGSATRTSTSGLDVAPATNESTIEVNYCEAKVRLI